MSYSDNGYDITNFFYRFKTILANTLFLLSLINVGLKIGKLDGGEGWWKLLAGRQLN